MNSALRILVIDDNRDIHEDFRKVFARAADQSHHELDQMQADFFADAPSEAPEPSGSREIIIDSAFQGKDGIEMALEAMRKGEPHLMAFVDVRMPPGMDGVQTVKQLWQHWPDLPCVLCTAYSDYDWQETRRELTHANNLLILKKPFDPIEVLQVVESIAEKTELSRASREYRVELERQIEELQRAQAELRQTNEELEIARSDAEAAVRAKGEFLANMSHELRTPLNGVIAMMDMMLYTELDAQQDKYVRTAKHSGETLLELINDILDFSKIESGKVELEDTEFMLHREIEAVNTVVARKCQEKGLELACFVDPRALLRLRGDPARMRQILANLTSNAVKFTEQGEIVIEITVDREMDEQAWIKFAVTDTGIGIPEDRRERLFSSFSQVDASTTRKFGGTGLGLAISKQLCELMGGEIGYQSSSGSGSSFWFTLPFFRVGGTEAAASVLPPDFKGKRLLLVDENPKMREVLERQLRAWGLEVHSVNSLEEAGARVGDPEAATTPFTAILLDCDVQGARPDQLSTTLASIPTLRRVPIVLLIPLGQPGRVTELQGRVVAGFVNKPIVPSELFNVLIPLSQGTETKPGAVPNSAMMGSSNCRLPVPKTRYEQARILLAEDNAINQKVATQILKCFGYTFDVVTNGKQAVDALSRTHYDLVLMDCQMPEMDGYEATRLVRRREAEAGRDPETGLPIIALTANALEGDRQKCLRAGMTDYLSKPLRPEQLLDTIERYLHEALQVDRNLEQASQEELLAMELSATSPSLPAEPINFDAFVDRCMGDREFALQVLGEFQSQMPGELDRLAECVQRRDMTNLSSRAHTIKGLAANISAEGLREVAYRLEQAARTADVSAATTCVAMVRREWDRLQRYLDQAAAPAAP